MKINKLIANNLKQLTCQIEKDSSLGIVGLSGSGKSTFCLTIADETLKRIVTLLPKSEYRFLFSEKLFSNYSAQAIESLPLVFYLKKTSFSANPRSTVGTHTGIFKEIRIEYAKYFKKIPEFFSFNNSIMWCPKCKGRGTIAEKECPECLGSRYKKEINDFSIEIMKKKYSIIDINNISADKLLEISKFLNLSFSKIKLIENMIKLDIGYLSLDRKINTLSGGEMVRLLLAEFITECQNSLIIIDEISIGLDHNTLIKVINCISELGSKNQIWLIDHSKVVIDATNKKIIFGPKSGKNGGEIIEKELDIPQVFCEINESKVEDYYIFKNLSKRNINIDNLLIPKNRITSITGESGCGKSTLVKECIIPIFKKNYKEIPYEIIGQDKNQSVTSKSTIATFLDIKKKLEKYDKNIMDLDLVDVEPLLTRDKALKSQVNMLLELGLGYLSFNRKIQTLSTGEFQCLHLVSKIFEKNSEKEMLLIFDEPSKGLSQNILNSFMKILRDIIKYSKKTAIIIEHNSYLLECSDYIMDFGKRKESIEELKLIPSKKWILEFKKNFVCNNKKIASNIENKKGIEIIDKDIEKVFQKYENIFKGGILKNFSQTAQWIYSDYRYEGIEPVIAIDLENQLYSKNTFLFEIAGIINSIIALTHTNNVKEFDFYSKENLCECCKGTGKIETIKIDEIIKNNNKNIWDGLFYEDIMRALKKYNFTKIKFLFKEIKKIENYDLNKNYSEMSDIEKEIFLYGYWKNTFYDSNKKVQRRWKGIIYLIKKYMRSSESIFKKIIKENSEETRCPVCKGNILKHNIPLDVNGKDIRSIITSKIKENKTLLIKIPQIKEILEILDEDTFLNTDVSLLSEKKQVILKILEIKYASFLGYTIVLKNTSPFIDDIQKNINEISKNNRLFLLDYKKINCTKEEILEAYYENNKLKRTSYLYEIFGYKKISTIINKIRKEKVCQYCNGKGKLREENLYENIDITETSCSFCNETGLSIEGLNTEIEGVSIKEWYYGSIDRINKDLPDELKNLSLMSKICDLNKEQLIKLKEYLK